MIDYDIWKLNNGYDDEVCEHCECQTDDLNDVVFNDEDGDKQRLWLCETCIEDQVWVRNQVINSEDL